MPIVCEVFDYDIDKKALIGPAPLAARYAKAITEEYDNFGLLVDLSHIPMLHETIEESILPVKDYIRHAHMGNTVIKSLNAWLMETIIQDSDFRTAKTTWKSWLSI